MAGIEMRTVPFKDKVEEHCWQIMDWVERGYYGKAVQVCANLLALLAGRL